MTEIYTIRSGDTMSGIASVHGISLKDLMEINSHIEDPDTIYAGQPINVPSSGTNNNSGTSASANGSLPAWYNVALDELNVTEIEGSQHNPRILEYHATTTLKATTDETPWCSSFVNWCVEKSGLEGTDSAAARSWRTWGKKLSSPKSGCVVVFSSPLGPERGHVGFFKSEDGPHITVLGGNQKNSVNFSSYSKGRLLGYRWPS